MINLNSGSVELISVSPSFVVCGRWISSMAVMEKILFWVKSSPYYGAHDFAMLATNIKESHVTWKIIHTKILRDETLMFRKGTYM